MKKINASACSALVVLQPGQVDCTTTVSNNNGLAETLRTRLFYGHMAVWRLENIRKTAKDIFTYDDTPTVRRTTTDKTPQRRRDGSEIKTSRVLLRWPRVIFARRVRVLVINASNTLPYKTLWTYKQPERRLCGDSETRASSLNCLNIRV